MDVSRQLEIISFSVVALFLPRIFDFPPFFVVDFQFHNLLGQQSFIHSVRTALQPAAAFFQCGPPLLAVDKFEFQSSHEMAGVTGVFFEWC